VRTGAGVAGVEQGLQPRYVLGRLVHDASIIRAINGHEAVARSSATVTVAGSAAFA